MNNMYKVCIVLQGQIYPEIIDELFKTYKDVKDIIISTWNTENMDCINKCREKGFEVILQDPPEYTVQANYQVKSLSAGFKRAIELGYTHAFRCRTDIKINNIVKLLDLLQSNIPLDKLSFLTMYKNNISEPEYLTDHIVYGPLEKLSNYWKTYQLPNDARFIELFLMETYFNKTNMVLNDIKNEITFFMKICYENGITVEFTKPQYRDQGNMLLRYYLYNQQPFFMNEKNELNIKI
jgi:hypothetical protein